MNVNDNNLLLGMHHYSLNHLDDNILLRHTLMMMTVVDHNYYNFDMNLAVAVDDDDDDNILHHLTLDCFDNSHWNNQ